MIQEKSVPALSNKTASCEAADARKGHFWAKFEQKRCFYWKIVAYEALGVAA